MPARCVLLLPLSPARPLTSLPGEQNYYNSDKSLSSARGSAQKLANLVQSQGAEKFAAAERSAKGNQGGKMRQEKIGGDLEAEPNTEDGDSFVKIRNPQKEEE